MAALTLSSAPSVEPILLPAAKLHLKQDDEADNDLISTLIVAARRWCESRLGQQLITATWALKLDCFPAHCIELPKPPLVSVSSITYYDLADSSQTLSSSLYAVDSSSIPGRVAPVFGQSWPATYERLNAVTITYVAGYGAAGSDVPATIRAAMLLLIGHWYENRESVSPDMLREVPQAAESLLMSEWHGSYSLAGVG